MYYRTGWEPEITTEVRIEAMEKELRGLREELAWNTAYAERLRKSIIDKQEALDLEVAEHLKHK